MRPLVLGLSIWAVLAASVFANEPTRVEIEIPKAEIKQGDLSKPLPANVIADPLVLPVSAELQNAEVPGGGIATVSPQNQPLATPTAFQSEPKAAETRDIDLDVGGGRVQFDLAQKTGPSAVQIAELPPGKPAPLDAIVRANASRKLAGGVFIQQEHEGNLLATDPRDSSGSVFKYYRPTEMRPELMAQVQQEHGTMGKIGYGLRRSLNFWDKDPYKVWNAWSLASKLSYLEKLESAVAAAQGEQAAWSGKASLILERAPGAPDFIAKNPIMENPPYMAAHRGLTGAKFMLPEIITDKEHPATTMNEAVGRSRMIIGQTGHAGTQFHVFLKAEPARLQAQLGELQSALQLVNDVLFTNAALDSFQNVEHVALQPWHAGRSARVAELLAKADPDAHLPSGLDPDSEKHAFVGLRYWGMENGKAVISFEFRGANLPWKSKGNSAMGRGGELEGASMPERDYSQVEQYLTFLSLFAEKIAAGRAPRFSEPALDLDLKRAEGLLAARAKQRGFPADAYYGVADFASRVSGDKGTLPQGYLVPFAASAPGSKELDEFIDGFLQQSARVRAIERAGGTIDGERRNIQYMFWQDYAAWARGHAAKLRPRYEALFRASAAP